MWYNPAMAREKQLQALAEDFMCVTGVVPEIVYAGDPVLRTKTQEVDVEEGLEIGQRLGRVLKKYRKLTGMGRGLAAPQIGESKRVFVTLNENQEVDIFINPEIIRYSDSTNFFREVCISAGIISADVERSEAIRIKWIDGSGQEQEDNFSGDLARLIQHEYDHLEGILNLDRAVPGTISLATFDPLKEKLRDQPIPPTSF